MFIKTLSQEGQAALAVLENEITLVCNSQGMTLRYESKHFTEIVTLKKKRTGVYEFSLYSIKEFDMIGDKGAIIQGLKKASECELKTLIIDIIRNNMEDVPDFEDEE